MGATDASAVEELLLEAARKVDGGDNRDHYGAGVLQVADATKALAREQAIVRLGLLSLLMLLAYRWARSKGETSSPMSLKFLVPALFTGAGLLFFAPFGPLSRHVLAVDLLSRPLGDWDILIGANVHRFLPLAHAFVPLGLAAVFLRVRGSAPVLAGLSVGTASYLCSVVVLGHTSTPFGTVLTALWCLGHAMLCLYLGALLLSKKRV
jgi:serine protease